MASEASHFIVHMVVLLLFSSGSSYVYVHPWCICLHIPFLIRTLVKLVQDHLNIGKIFKLVTWLRARYCYSQSTVLRNGTPTKSPVEIYLHDNHLSTKKVKTVGNFTEIAISKLVRLNMFHITKGGKEATILHGLEITYCLEFLLYPY